MGSQIELPKKVNIGIPKEKMPKHIAIILDGNRRFAKRLNLDVWKGHEYGDKKVKKLLEWCYSIDVNELTLYAFSMQNFNRPKLEFDYLMKLFKESAKELLTEKKIDELGVKIRFIGRIDLFDEELSAIMHQIMEKTKNNKNYTLNLAMAYGGREELADAIKLIIKDYSQGKINELDLNDNLISNYLYMQDEPDLIIRTSGEIRTSNFLPYQSIYSEWIFLNKTWPEFEKEDLIECIKEYSKRDRRQGK